MRRVMTLCAGPAAKQNHGKSLHARAQPYSALMQAQAHSVLDI
jgi:hypothetical protein